MTIVAARIAFALAILVTMPAFAPMSAEHQRIREFQAVARRAANLFPDAIEAVEFVGSDIYRARSGRCSVEIRVVDARPAARAVHSPGSRRFRLSASSVECRGN